MPHIARRDLRHPAPALAAVRARRADAVADFYKGKDLRMIVSTTAGTGYDTYARAVGRHLPRHIPGNPAIIVQNMPGAGGLTAANHIYSVAPQDGTVFGMIQNTVPFEPLFENKVGALRSDEDELARHADDRGRPLHRLPHRQGADARRRAGSARPSPAPPAPPRRPRSTVGCSTRSCKTKVRADRRLSRPARASALDGAGRDQRHDLAVLVEPEDPAARTGTRRRRSTSRSSTARRRIPT